MDNMGEDLWKTNIFYPATGVGESSGTSSSSSPSIAGSSNEARQTLLFSQINPSTEQPQQPSKCKEANTSRRRACDNCVRRRSRCDGERPCNACKLHDTESTCQKQCPTQVKTNNKDCSSIFCRACQNCWSRKSKCDRTYPCSGCISKGLQESCYEEKGVERDALHQDKQKQKITNIPPKSQQTKEQKQVSKRACYNCWYRKNKCSKQKPCTSCVFHGCTDSCFVELDKHSEQAESLRQKMNEKRQIRAKAKAIAHIQNKERRNSIATQPNSDTLTTPPSQEQTETPFETIMHRSWTKLASMPNVESAISLAGNFDLANDWPSVDEDVVQLTLAKIRAGSSPEAIESAYIYALLAICAIALPTLHPLKATGQILERNNIFIFKQEAILLMGFVSDPNNIGSSTPAPLLECRVFHALAWICMYSQQSREAHYFSEQSILSARLANIINGFSDDDSLYTPEEVQQRDTSRAIVFEVFSLAEWISFSSSIPSSMPLLSDDIKRYATSSLHEKDVLPSLWRAWKLHSSTWMGNALRHEREIHRKNDDGTDRMTLEEKDIKTLEFIERMEADEKQIDESTKLLSEKFSAIEIKENLDDIKIARRQNANLAAQYTTYIIRNMLAARSLQNGSMNLRLSVVALNAVYKLVHDLPNVIALQHSQHQFPPLKHFMAKMYEAGMQTTFGAINRLREVELDYDLAKQMSSLLLIVPRSYNLMNQYGLTGPFSFAVQSACTAVPIHRPIHMINYGLQPGFTIENSTNSRNNEWDGQQLQQQQAYSQIMWNPPSSFSSSPTNASIVSINPLQWNDDVHNNLSL
jgi:Fungal Zn(2)-Cys(6) binuclear cluster domain